MRIWSVRNLTLLPRILNIILIVSIIFPAHAGTAPRVSPPNQAFISPLEGPVSETLPVETSLFHLYQPVSRSIKPLETPSTIAWARQFGSTDYDQAYSVALDSSGNIYVAGITKGALFGQVNVGDFDAFLVKYDPTGSVAWTRQFGSSSYDYAFSVAVDGSGNIYVVGWTHGALPGLVNLGIDDDAFLAKYDAAGSVTWTRQFGTSSYDRAYSVAVDGLGNTYVAGVTSGAFPGHVREGSYDAFLVKFDFAGSVAWTRQFGPSNEDTAFSVAVDSSGNIYVAGWTAGTFPGQVNVGAYDIFLVKYNAAGSIAWTRQFGSPSHDFAYSVTADGSGNVYVAGNASGALPGQVYMGINDAFLVKYDVTGSVAWIRQFGSSSYDYARSVVGDSLGNNYIAGWTGGALPGQVNMGGLNDAFLVKYDAAGSVAWTRQFGSSSYDYAYSVAVDGSGNAYVAGVTGGSFSGQVSLGGDDAFLVKFSVDTSFPAAPVLTSPPHTAILSSLPTLDWSDISGSSITYNLLVDDSSDFSSPVLNVSKIVSSTYTIASDLRASTAYFWKVRANDGAGNSGNFSSVRSFTLDRTTKFITLSAGWNMIGLPLSPDGATAGYQFGDDMVSVFLFNYNPLSGVYDTLKSSDMLNMGKGYWIKLPADTTIDLEGIPAGTGGSFSIPLSAGWNQIGYPFTSSLPLSSVRVRYQGQEVNLAAAAANGWVKSVFYEYSTSSQLYITPSQLNPFKGYWVQANVAAELLIPPP